MEEEQYYGLEVERQKKLLASFCFLVEGTWKFHVPSTSEKCFESETSSFTQSEKSYLLTVARLSKTNPFNSEF